MQYIIYDLEATCWEKGTRPDRMEIIEIGAVRVDATKMTIMDEFDTFVQPVIEPEPSEFCRNLTSIRQEDVDCAPTFPDAFNSFLDWIGTTDVILCSWGSYDRKQLLLDVRRQNISDTFSH
jgi:3'-5' exoribonuclease 1